MNTSHLPQEMQQVAQLIGACDVRLVVNVLRHPKAEGIPPYARSLVDSITMAVPVDPTMLADMIEEHLITDGVNAA